MLLRLLVEKFALVERNEIDFEAGLNLITGETGTGKSIIVDAMNVVLGGHAATDYIRSGAERAVVEALFDISEVGAVKAKLNDFGLEKEDDDNLLLTREISRGPKNTCRINGRAVTLGMYKEVGRQLVDIYGQHHQQSLLEKEKHINLLDSFGGRQVQDLLVKTTNLYRQYHEISEKIAEIKTNEQERVRKLDVFRYQLREIDDARLSPGEDANLENERNLLANAEKLAQLCTSVYETLYEGNASGPAALDAINNALAGLRELYKIDPQLGSFTETAENALYQLEEVARDVGRYRDRVEYSPARLDEVNNRLEQIKQLKRKYGATVEEILAYREQLAASAGECERADELAAAMEKKLAEVQSEYEKIAGELSKTRKSIAGLLEQSVTAELAYLAMPQVRFNVDIKKQSSPGSRGVDEVEFLISPNPGEPLKPLAKIVSGGEMSRIMLALKTILAKVDAIPTMIFDEVDAGLGGKAVQAVAEKLALIGRDRQVICVTHSPQIASFADVHFNISKITTDAHTETSVTRLKDTERAGEISRMLGGDNITELTKKHAREMLETAAKWKKF